MQFFIGIDGQEAALISNMTEGPTKSLVYDEVDDHIFTPEHVDNELLHDGARKDTHSVSIHHLNIGKRRILSKSM